MDRVWRAPRLGNKNPATYWKGVTPQTPRDRSSCAQDPVGPHSVSLHLAVHSYSLISFGVDQQPREGTAFLRSVSHSIELTEPEKRVLGTSGFWPVGGKHSDDLDL